MGIFQHDVNNAFRHGDLDEMIFMKFSRDFESPCPTVVCKLKKLLYGLWQGSRQWYSKLTSTLNFKCHKHSYYDYSLFSK